MLYIYKDTKDERLVSDANIATYYLKKMDEVERETYMRQLGQVSDVTSSTLEPSLGAQSHITAFVPNSLFSAEEYAAYAEYFNWMPEVSNIFESVFTLSGETTSHDVSQSDSKLYLLEDIGNYLGKEIKDRLIQLDGFAAEDTSIEALDNKSMRAFLDFMIGFNINEIPELYSASTGNLIAEWRKNKDNKLVIEFLDNGQLKFIVFYRDILSSGNINRFSGMSSANSFLVNVSAPQVKEFLGLE